MTHHAQPACLDSQALQPWGGRKPIRRSTRQFDFERLEDRIVPAITINNGSFDYEGIAAAVSAASGNDTIHITTIDMPSGGYVGSATIDKSLTIVGTPDGSGNRPVLKAPTDTSSSNGAVLYFTGSSTTVTMSHLSITGTGDALDDFTAGIWVDDDATLTFSNGDITAINSSFGTTALPGGTWTSDWVGTGIVVGNTSTGGTAYLDNITIEEYQLFGVYALHADSYVSLTNSTVTGRGLIEQAQIGVRITGGAVALIDENTITVNQYDGMYYNAGIVLRNSGVGTIITNNTISYNDAGIWHYAPDADSIANATLIQGNTFTDNLIGIVLEPGTANIHNNTITGGNYGIFAQVLSSDTQDAVGYLTGNTITGSSVAATDTYDDATGADPVLIANQAPTIDDPTAQSSFKGDVVSLQIDADDADEDTLTYSATGLPTGLSINSSTGLITGTISTSASTTTPYTVTISASDGIVTTNRTLDWTVSAAYVIVVQGDQYHVAGQTVEVPLYVWKVTGHTLTYGATGLPSGLSINTSTGVISGTIDYGEDSSEPYEVTITATDTAGDEEDEVTFDWYVVAPEIFVHAPDTVESIVGTANVSLSIAGFATEGASLAYSAAGLPSGLTIDPDTGEITGTIAGNADLYSPYSVMVTLTNSSADVTEYASFSWIVKKLVVRNPGAQADLVSSAISFTVEAPYAGLGTVAFSASGLPSGLSINSSTGEISGTIASNADASSPYSVTITATDGTLSADTTFDWTVRKLLVDAVGDRYSLSESTPTLEIGISSLSGHTITFAASGLPAGLSINSSTGVISGTIEEGAESASPYTVTVTVTDTTASVNAIRTFDWHVTALLQGQGAQYVPLPKIVGEGRLRYLEREIANAEQQLGLANDAVERINGLITTVQGEIAQIVINNPNNFQNLEAYQTRVQSLQDFARDRQRWDNLWWDIDRRLQGYNELYLYLWLSQTV
jgi:hypothetical protein